MICKYCGKEIQKEWKICPSCGTEILAEKKDTETECREYRLKGMRRTGRFSFQDMTTDIKVEGGSVHVVTKGVKESESRFHKQEVQNIDLPLLPVWKISDILRLAVFGLLAWFTYGLSMVAVLFSIKIMVSRHVRIKLNSGKTVKIPICQKGDASEFLKEFQYPLSEIEKNNADRIEDKKWARREWITSAALLALAAAAIATGITLKSESMKNSEAEDEETGNTEIFNSTEDKALEEGMEERSEEAESMTIEEYISHCEKITGKELARNPEEYIGKDIILEGKFNILSDSIVIDWFADSGIIRVDYDGKAIDAQGSVVGNVMSGDYGYVAGRYGGEDEWGTRYITAEIIILDNGADEDTETNISEVQDYIFPESGSRYLSEEEVRNVETDRLRIARNEIFARHGYIFNDEELQSYFSNTSWYTGTVPAEQFNMDEVLNDFEKKNAELIGKVEDERNEAERSEEFTIRAGVYVNDQLFEDHKALLTFIYYEGDEVGVEFSTEPQLNSIVMYGVRTDERTIQVAEEYTGVVATLTWDNENEVTVTCSGEFTGMDSALFDKMVNTHYTLESEL